MDFWNELLGLNAEYLKGYQMAVRAFILFFASLIMVRISGIRTLGKQTAFDQLTALMLGGIMARTVVTGKSFFGSLLASLVIMVLHRLMAWISFKNKKLGSILKGKPVLLQENENRQIDNQRKTHITDDDIKEALRTNLNTSDTSKIKEVYLERSGEISIVER